ncbi:MAG: hypothetical protein HYU62_13270 [Caulobacterales bacterium]|nr:hypothetical protein [Caulobacterales bacterium]
MKAGSNPPSGKLICFALALALAACDRVEPTAVSPSTPAPGPIDGDTNVAVASTATVFDLSPDEKSALSERALAGDSQASFRLAEFYMLAGGDGDPNLNDEHDRREERRWLKLAAQQGHPVAKSNYAISLAEVDCPRARSIMIEVRDHAPKAASRENARSWLNEPRFACPE